MLIAGPTGCGKTSYTRKLLLNLDVMYENDPPKEVIFCYGIWQPAYEALEAELPFITFHKGLPTPELLKPTGNHVLYILDDLSQLVVESPEIRLMFTQGCHHNKWSVIFISQNLYQKGKHARTISLNCWYLILFRNWRDVNQIRTLATQTGLGKKLVSAYDDATKSSYQSLVLDFAPNSNEQYRIRSRIFPGEDPWIYI